MTSISVELMMTVMPRSPCRRHPGRPARPSRGQPFGRPDERQRGAARSAPALSGCAAAAGVTSEERVSPRPEPPRPLRFQRRFQRREQAALTSIGLATWPSMPAARYSADLVGHGVGGQRDDRGARRGRARPRAARIARVAVGPSISGIWMSIRITSQSPVSQASSAACAVVDHGRLDADLVEQGLQHQLVDRVVLGRQHPQRRPARGAAAALAARRGCGAAPRRPAAAAA